MVYEMDSNSNHSNNSNNAEEVLTNSCPPSTNSFHTTNSVSARQSPKITSSMIASPAASSSSAPGALVPASTNSIPSALCVSALVRNTSSPAAASIPRKVMSKNHNNTVFSTSFPSNLAELQLFRVMQNASLLYYYDTLLEMGGDDVQQLCDAGEEEFLEIMSLVGMASKPLHVRRFQKSLQEWVTHPAKFKQPLAVGEDFDVVHQYSTTFEETARVLYGGATSSSPASPSTSNKRPYSPLDACPPSSSSSPGGSSGSNSNTTPTLVEAQISKLAAAAERLSKHLPQFEPKPPNNKKKMCKELEIVMSMPETDPRRMDEIRRYAAIYGRFDCKRRPEKPLTLHEVSVNEAAAQICRFVPALLTRRDELFPLARQVVKDSGCHYSKTGVGYSTMCLRTSQSSDLIDTLSNSNSNPALLTSRHSRLQGGEEGPPAKRTRFEDGDGHQQQDYLKQFEASARSSIHFSASLLHAPKTHTSNRICSLGTDDETDNYPLSNSNSNSPLRENDKLDQADTDLDAQEVEPSTEDGTKYSPRVQVIAASGDNIIAVANPALALSSAILPLEHLTE